ncbi:hypothetical protein ACJQWK_05167 [Exserohilum turcicum]
MQHLSQRLEQLEKHVGGASDENSPSAPHMTPKAEEATERRTPVPSPEASLTVADGQESWIYRLATDARRSFQTQATPVNTPARSIDNAMLSLNEALEDLGRFRVRTKAINVDLEISPEQARECVDRFPTTVNSMIVPDALMSSMVDMSVLRALPDIINSPYVAIDPGVRVMYYNALYYGLRETNGPGHDLTVKAYLKVLESVPAWLESPRQTNMDGLTATLTAWTSNTMHDYQLAWKFHCKSCQYIISKGMDQIDATPARSFAEEEERDPARYLYWHALCTDVLLRLVYGKPKVLKWVPGKVRPPFTFRLDNMQPSAMMVTIGVVWIRYTFLTDELISYVDSHASFSSPEDLFQKTDECCRKLEELIAEWRLEQLMNDTDTLDDHRCMLADHIMNMLAYMIGMQRLVHTAVRNSATAGKPSPFAVRAARKVSSIILIFHNDPAMKAKSMSSTNHFITMYPFCVVFTLYEHILACGNPDDCESDIQTLESIGVAMNEACAQRRDLVPFAKTVDALNRVSRTLQEERRKVTVPNLMGEPGYNTNPSVELAPTSFDTIQNLVATELPDFDMSAFSMPEYPPDTDFDFQSLGLFRALENDFVARNWQTDWWDLGGGVSDGLGQTPGSATNQPGNPAYLP